MQQGIREASALKRGSPLCFFFNALALVALFVVATHKLPVLTCCVDNLARKLQRRAEKSLRVLRSVFWDCNELPIATARREVPSFFAVGSFGLFRIKSICGALGGYNTKASSTDLLDKLA
eukprot:804019-Prorocentrum_minimum.AAC.1